jgi:hypothetical protein
MGDFAPSVSLQYNLCVSGIDDPGGPWVGEDQEQDA